MTTALEGGHAPAALYPRDRLGTRTGGWVGPRTGLDRCGKSLPLTGIRSPDRPVRSQSMYRLRYLALRGDMRGDGWWRKLGTSNPDRTMSLKVENNCAVFVFAVSSISRGTGEAALLLKTKACCPTKPAL
jgi:hypothetical protein